MKIILASDLSFLLKYGYALTGIPQEQMKIGYVNTAAKGARHQEFFATVKSTIKERGYNFEEIDIEGKSLAELRSFFADKNVIHIEGGNTFYLLKAVRETGFAVVLRELLEAGKVYIGTSAGAYLMCPSIEVSNWNDDGRDNFGVTDFTALGYVPFFLKVHYRDEYEEQVKENRGKLIYPLRILRDGEGILIEDGKDIFYSDQKETIVT